jgi:dipeptidyl aminopeptidase/acylaminoacyl peptidase
MAHNFLACHSHPIVPVIQAEAMAGALQRRGIPCRLLVFPAEGHGFGREATIRQALEAALAFYQEMLRL